MVHFLTEMKHNIDLTNNLNTINGAEREAALPDFDITHMSSPEILKHHTLIKAANLNTAG